MDVEKYYKTMNEEILKPIAEKMNSKFVLIEPEKSEITIFLQNEPIKEVGQNGTQIDTLGKIWLEILRGFNKKFPCRENSLTITKIEEALMWQAKRTQNREERGVEGRNVA